MTSKPVLPLVLSALFLAMPVLGQTTIRGTIRDAESGAPLVGANVVVEGTTDGAVSDPDGRFRLSIAGPLPVTLRFSYIGYSTDRREANGAETDFAIALEPRIVTSDAVVVSASRRTEKLTEAPAAISVLYARDLEAQTLTNPVEALRGTAGVDISEQGINNYTVTLRGRNLAFDTATHILIDNRHATTPGLAVTIFGRQALNPDDIERIEVIQGPGSALYGPGVDAGVIHFITKSPFDHPGTTVTVAGGSRSSLRMTGTHRGVAGTRLGYKLTGMYARATNWEYDPEDPDDAAFLGVFPDSVFSGVDGRFDRAIDGIEPETFSYGASGSLQYRFRGSTSLTADAGYTRYRGINRFGLGEVFNDFPEIYGQLRFAAGRLFAQAHYLHAANDERTFLYRTGRTLSFNNRQYELQLQHATDLPSLRTALVYGGEYRLVTSDTRRTINGMFEEDDETVVYGAYLQSQSELTPRLSLTLAGRLDRFDTIRQTFFSPRAGIVFRPDPSRSFRLTVNRAYAAPTGLSLFTDVAVADLADLEPGLTGDVQLVGGALPITFDGPRRTVPFFPGVEPWDGVGVPLGIAYAAALEALAGSLSEPALMLLESKAGVIDGFSAGITADVERGIGLPIRERNYLIKPRRTDMVEAGFTWVAPRIFVTASAYYTWKQDFESDIRVFGPLVVALTLGDDLAGAVSGAVSDAELQEAGLTRDGLESLFSEAGESMAAVGLIQPDQLPYDGRPKLVGTFVNYGSIDYAGLELSATALLTEQISVTAAVTHLGQVEFDDDDLGLSGTGERYALNLPQNSFGVRADFREGAAGWSASAAYRYKQAFEGDFGELFAGTVDAQNLVDASAGFAWPGGLALNVTAQNVFDTEYRSFVGLPKIGRLVLASVRYTF
jgi:iron complex outermembrane receptor protein